MRNKKLPGAPGLTTRSKGATRAPGITTRKKKLLVTSSNKGLKGQTESPVPRITGGTQHAVQLTPTNTVESTGDLVPNMGAQLPKICFGMESCFWTPVLWVRDPSCVQEAKATFRAMGSNSLNSSLGAARNRLLGAQGRVISDLHSCRAACTQGPGQQNNNTLLAEGWIPNCPDIQ